MADKKMPFTEHLAELRRRIIISLIGIGIGFALAYNFSPQIILFLKGPYTERLQAIRPTEAFFAHLTVAFLAGVFLSLPLTLYQAWMFVAPGLLEREKRFALPFVVSSVSLFVLGAAFCYYVVLWFAVNFLSGGWWSEYIESRWTVGSYISFVFWLFLAFGISFQMPLVAILLTRMGVVTPATLTRNRRYAVVFMVIIAAVVTPTADPLNMGLLAVPLLILYEISILLSRVVYRQRVLREARHEA